MSTPSRRNGSKATAFGGGRLLWSFSFVILFLSYLSSSLFPRLRQNILDQQHISLIEIIKSWVAWLRGDYTAATLSIRRQEFELVSLFLFVFDG
jgi:hypothetical protein